MDPQIALTWPPPQRQRRRHLPRGAKKPNPKLEGMVARGVSSPSPRVRQTTQLPMGTGTSVQDHYLNFLMPLFVCSLILILVMTSPTRGGPSPPRASMIRLMRLRCVMLSPLMNHTIVHRASLTRQIPVKPRTFVQWPPEQ